MTATRRHREFERVVNPEAWIRTVALNRFGPDGGTPRWSSDTRDWCPGLSAPSMSDLSALPSSARRPTCPSTSGRSSSSTTCQTSSRLTADGPGLPEGTVKSRLSRARERLLGLLDERGEPRHGPVAVVDGAPTGTVVRMEVVVPAGQLACPFSIHDDAAYWMVEPPEGGPPEAGPVPDLRLDLSTGVAASGPSAAFVVPVYG